MVRPKSKTSIKILMKKLSYVLIALTSLLSCNTKAPTTFSEAALNDILINQAGEKVTLQHILNTHKGKTIVIDIWASWCSDCINGMPKVKALQNEFKDVVYLFFSLDRGQAAWKYGIEKYNVVGEHYYLPSGKKSAIGDFVNINWIPRYMVIDTTSKIALFKAIKADDKKLLQALKK